ncbi:hypothetical protein ABE036_18155 [Priestia aryabhattai]|uniref:hypothetical protein n=1 Tax=Priestia TaxID=2800373 RepID=UPI0012B6E1A6|nr:hypothetical protein [Priestia megaterium]
MNYEKQFAILKEEIKELEEGKVKNSLTKIENILDCLHKEFVVQREEKVITRIAEHISKRKSEIRSGKELLKLEADVPKLVVHFIPFSAFEFEMLNFEIGLNFKNYQGFNLKPLYVETGYDYRIDKDGVYAYKDYYGYSKLNSTGVFEAVELGMFSYNAIYSSLVEAEILEVLKTYQQVLSKVEHKGDFLVSIQFLNVKEFSLIYRNEIGLDNSTKPYKEEDLILRPIVLSSIKENVDLAIKPIFDELWRAFGFTGSKNYVNGEYVKDK